MSKADNQTLVSVIVPVFNGGKFLGVCLDALSGSDYPKFEIIVVDDGSTDDSADIGRRKGATVIESERRQSGPAAARNLAAKRAKGEILLFVDADVVVGSDTISNVVEAFCRYPEISALFGSYDDSPAEGNFLSQYKNLQHHFIHQTSNPEASTFWAGLGAVRSDVFASLGGFDCVKFAVPSIEDIELGFRLRSAGHRILLDRSIQAKHLKKWTLVSLVKTEIFCRAAPWSKLILTSKGMINDMNLKTTDRLSSVLVSISLLALPFLLWNPWLIVLPLFNLLAIAFLNRKILLFFAVKKGSLFAALTFPWLVFYFFYSGVTFVLSWFRYALPRILSLKKGEELNGTGSIN
jgi:glycosyltransferase involved in cell wall biosynthesis